MLLSKQWARVLAGFSACVCAHIVLRTVWSCGQELKAKTTDWAWKNGLPILSVDGKEFTQSLAALRYAGKKVCVPLPRARLGLYLPIPEA